MLRAIKRPREEISANAPRLIQIQINPEKIGLLIGPGGLGITGGQPVVDRICTAVVWLAGLSAVVLLWQRSSRVFFGRRRA